MANPLNEDLTFSTPQGRRLIMVAVVAAGLAVWFLQWYTALPALPPPSVLFARVPSVSLSGGELSVGDDFAEIHESLDCIVVCVERQNDISDEDTIQRRLCRGPRQVFRLIVETTTGSNRWLIRAIDLARPGPGAPPGRLVDRDKEMIRRERRDCVQTQQAIAERFDERRRRRERQSY